MKILVLSDLHYGFSQYTHTILENFFKTLPAHDLCIISGDLISHNQTQWAPLFKLLNKYVPNFTFVKGNHDLWHLDQEEQKKTLWALEDYQRLTFIAGKADKKYLPNNPIITDRVVIVGFDGWYGSELPPSKDSWMIPKVLWSPTQLEQGQRQELTMVALKERAIKDMYQCVRYAKMHGKDKTTICVTHHNPYVKDYIWKDMSADTKMEEIIKNNFDYLICGHNHQFKDEDKIKNCGSDYDDPQFLLFEV